MSEIKDFINEHPKLFNISTLEEIGGITRYRLQHYLNGEKYRDLTPDQEKKLRNYFAQLGKKMVKNFASSK